MLLELVKKFLGIGLIKRVRASLFIQRVFLTLLTRFFLLLASIVVSILTARYLGPEGRGILAITTTVYAIGVQFGNFGLHGANTYFVAKNKSLLGAAIGNTIWLGIIIGLVVGFCVTGFFYVFPQFAGGVRVLYIAIAALGIPFGLLFMLGGNLVLGIQHIKVYNGIEIAQAIINVVAIAALLILFQQGAFSLVILATIAAFLLCSTVILYLVKVKHPVFKFDFPLFKKMAGYGFKAYLASLLMFSAVRVSLFMVNYLVNTSEVGIYSIVSGIADYTTMIPASIGMILLPQVSSMSSGQWEYSRKVAAGTAFIMGGICILAVFLARPFVSLLYGQEYIGAVSAILWLLPGVFLYSVNTIFMNHFAAKGLPAIIILSPAIGLVATFLLNLYFIPHFGIDGAAIVSSISYTLMFMFSVIYLKLNVNMRK